VKKKGKKVKKKENRDDGKGKRPNSSRTGEGLKKLIGMWGLALMSKGGGRKLSAEKKKRSHSDGEESWVSGGDNNSREKWLVPS